MNTVLKQKTPLFFLIIISAFWAFYYQGSHLLNDFGTANHEWLFMVDGLLVLPLLCFFCIKDKKQAATKAAVMACLVVLIGSYIIPEPSKQIWHHLESGRYVVLGLFLLFEVTALATVFLAIKAALNTGTDPDSAISQPIQRWLGDGLVAKVLMFEARMWTYALFSKGIQPRQFTGDQHFSYHAKDGAQSNLVGFVMLILFELPLMHLLLHFIWSPMAANIVTALTCFSLVFFIAEYRALSKRPISLLQDKLIIRYGLYAPMVIALNNIASIEINDEYIPRSKDLKRYNYAGNPNVVIHLVRPDGDVKRVYMGVDNPVALIQAVEESID